MGGYLIRGGTVIDGTGAKSYGADVRILGDRITEIGRDLKPSNGEQVVDAAGCYVTPGFIETHTHYDGTLWWQPDLDPLPGYGVTTVVMGNCGFSAAPVSANADARLEMVKIFSFFEDIPIEPFLKELPWNWRSWSEYRRSLTGSVKVPANYGAFTGHIAIRLAVMGMDAWERVATSAEIEQMCAALDDALQSGAMGMSSNLHDHDGNNRPVPTMVADDAEFAALIGVLEKYPGTTLQIIVDTFMRQTGPQSVERIGRLTEGRKVRVQWAGVPTLIFQKKIQGPLYELHERFKREGRDMWTGYSHTSITNTLGVNHSLIFAQSNDYVWHEVVLAKTEAEKIAIMQSPDWRARARESWDTQAWKHSPLNNPQDLLLLNSDNGVGPVNLTLLEYAKQLGVHHSDAMAEWLLANGLQSTVHMAPFPKDEEMVAKLLVDPNSVGNISDAGAHGQMLCGGGENVTLFTKYVKKLGVISMEQAVYVQTGKLAEHFGFADRGKLQVGKRADVTVFHPDEIQYRPMKKVYDVPDGRGGKTWRWTRDAAPVRITLVNGQSTFENGAPTGTRPGVLVSPSRPNA